MAKAAVKAAITGAVIGGAMAAINGGGIGEVLEEAAWGAVTAAISAMLIAGAVGIKVSTIVSVSASTTTKPVIITKTATSTTPNSGVQVRQVGVQTTYDINKLHTTQPRSYLNESIVKNMMETIRGGGTVPPIPVHVYKGKALLVDGHHRLEAFSRLGFQRVPIKYVRSNQLGKALYRTLEQLIQDSVWGVR